VRIASFLEESIASQGKDAVPRTQENDLKEQIEKTKQGGYLRRRQEACAIIKNFSKYFAQQHIIIKEQVRKERRRVISLYHADCSRTRSE